ncbi:MAG: dihydrodipicolinate synthase family protein [Actinobacteria bacterium]|nr:dihydrodipicolinate synthase family protein [Actinomycetota bacterium]
MKNIVLNGLIPAIVIPLKKDFSVDEQILRRYISHIVKSGIKALAVNTDAGESILLSKDEKKRILSIAVEETNQRIPVICGLSGANTRDAVDFGRELKDTGADAFLVFPQAVFRGGKGRDNVVIEYHKSMAKLGVPLIIFQLQEDLGGVEYSEETMEALINIDNVIAIKEACFDALKFKETVWFLHSLKKKITILTGNDNFIPESFILGADGALIGFGSIFTDIQVQVVQQIKNNNYKEALSLFRKIDDICRICFGFPVRDYRARIKEVLAQQGIFEDSIVRPPLLPLSQQEKEKIHSAISAISHENTNMS